MMYFSKVVYHLSHHVADRCGIYRKLTICNTQFITTYSRSHNNYLLAFDGLRCPAHFSSANAMSLMRFFQSIDRLAGLLCMGFVPRPGLQSWRSYSDSLSIRSEATDK